MVLRPLPISHVAFLPRQSPPCHFLPPRFSALTYHYFRKPVFAAIKLLFLCESYSKKKRALWESVYAISCLLFGKTAWRGGYIWLLTFRYLEEWEEQEFDCYPPRKGLHCPCLTELPLPALPTINFPPLPPSSEGGTGGSLGYPSLPLTGFSPGLTAPDSCWESTSESAKLG